MEEDIHMEGIIHTGVTSTEDIHMEDTNHTEGIIDPFNIVHIHKKTDDDWISSCHLFFIFLFVLSLLFQRLLQGHLRQSVQSV